MPHIILIGTLDTKLEEFLYLRSQLQEFSQSTPATLKITTIDCGRFPVDHHAISISQSDLVGHYGVPNTNEPFDFRSSPRGEVIKYMIKASSACVNEILQRDEVHGILSAGGSGGTSLVSAVMREVVPLGMPKLIVSTVASGDTGPIVGETDIMLMYSVVDIAGSNAMLREVLSNAAGAMLGMSNAYEKRISQQKRIDRDHEMEGKVRVGVTMFGVTTPCVDHIRKDLTEKYGAEVFVFHATGHGGKAMERMIMEGKLDAILDVTTTEICDHLIGGNMSAGPDRLQAALRRGLPYVISVGATDMVNFGPMGTVPEKYRSRKLFEHNPTVTLMRTSKEECRMVGEFIVEKVNTYAAVPDKVQIWLPRGGVSMLDQPGGSFNDDEANRFLLEAIKLGLPGGRVVEDPRYINDPGFAIDMAERLMMIIDQTRQAAA